MNHKLDNTQRIKALENSLKLLSEYVQSVNPDSKAIVASLIDLVRGQAEEIHELTSRLDALCDLQKPDDEFRLSFFLHYPEVRNLIGRPESKHWNSVVVVDETGHLKLMEMDRTNPEWWKYTHPEYDASQIDYHVKKAKEKQ